MAFLRMPDFFSDLLGWLAGPGCSPSLVHGDGYRGDGSAIHTRKTYPLALRTAHRPHASFLQLKSLLNDKIDRAFRLGVVNCGNGSHGGSLAEAARKGG